MWVVQSRVSAIIELYIMTTSIKRPGFLILDYNVPLFCFDVSVREVSSCILTTSGYRAVSGMAICITVYMYIVFSWDIGQTSSRNSIVCLSGILCVPVELFNPVLPVLVFNRLVTVVPLFSSSSLLIVFSLTLRSIKDSFLKHYLAVSFYSMYSTRKNVFYVHQLQVYANITNYNRLCREVNG